MICSRKTAPYSLGPLAKEVVADSFGPLAVCHLRLHVCPKTILGHAYHKTKNDLCNAWIFAPSALAMYRNCIPNNNDEDAQILLIDDYNNEVAKGAIVLQSSKHREIQL